MGDCEAWNDLAAVHMFLENYKSALHALSEAGKLQRNNWKIWENMLTCALKLKKLSKSISVLAHLLEIRKETVSMNTNIMAAITIELTAKIQKYDLQQNESEEKEKNEEIETM